MTEVYTDAAGGVYASDTGPASVNDQLAAFPADLYVSEMVRINGLLAPDSRIDCWEYSFTARTGLTGSGGPIT